jgi:hypothetical protein
MTNGKDTLREWTTENRGFSFNSIRPGKWTVKVYDDNLPAYHYLDKAEFQIEVKPGEAKEITASVLPHLRPIQIIEEGEIKQENE